MKSPPRSAAQIDSPARQEPAIVKYDHAMDSFGPAEAPAAPQLLERNQIPDRFKWDLTNIFPDWHAWDTAYKDLDGKISAFAGLQGTLANGSDALLAAHRLRDDIGQLSYKVWY